MASVTGADIVEFVQAAVEKLTSSLSLRQSGQSLDWVRVSRRVSLRSAH